MTGIFYKAPQAFTGAGAGELPMIHNALPVPGAVRRFIAAGTRVPEGSPVERWADEAGSGTALTTAGTTAPVMSTVAGVKAVKFNGTSDGLQQNLALPAGHSVVLVGNIVTPNTSGTTTLLGAYQTANVDAGRIQTSLTDLYVNAGQGLKVGAGLNVTGWRVIIVTFNGANSPVTVNGTRYTGDPGALPRAVFSLGFERAGMWSTLAVAEAAVYGRALTTADHDKLTAYLRDKYGI